MATGKGRSLGAAMHDFLEVVPQHRTNRQKTAYLLSNKTGASQKRVAQLLGVGPARIGAWASGKANPSKANQGKLDRLFERFWRINNPSKGGPAVGTQPIRITSTTGQDILVNGKTRSYILVEQGMAPRDLAKLQSASVAEINKKYGALLIKALDIPIPYLQFLHGPFTVELV